MNEETGFIAAVLRDLATSTAVILAAWGALGGATNALTTRMRLRDALRHILLGGLIAAGTTALARFGFGYGDAGARVPVENWPLYWGGVAVLVVALLPATGRWVGRVRRARIGQPGVTGAAETGAILWPGT